MVVCAAVIMSGCGSDSDDGDEGGGGNNMPDYTITYGSVSDASGNTYKTVKLAGQEWMAENLRTTKYADGNSISAASAGQRTRDTDGPLYFQNTEHNVSGTAPNYGLLYNWAAAARVSNCSTEETFGPNGRQGICPAGWHLPSENEWKSLNNWLKSNKFSCDAGKAGNFYIGKSLAGSTVQSQGGLWKPGLSVMQYEIEYFGDAKEEAYRNITGFNGLPAGSYFNGDMSDNGFLSVGISAGFWTPDHGGGIYNASCMLLAGQGLTKNNLTKCEGWSVRCVKN